MKINWKKSCPVGLNLKTEEYKDSADALDCQIRALPIDYLGVPLGSNPRSRDFWLPVIERCKRRLATLKANYLSFGGRITLFTAILSNLPIYYLSIFKIPKKIAQELETLQKQFSKENANFKHHLIKWELDSRSKKEGGLGIGRILKRNIALLENGSGDSKLEQSALWTSIIKRKIQASH